MLMLPTDAVAQRYKWSVTGVVGASMGYTKGDTLTDQGLLLPTFGLKASYETTLSRKVGLLTSLGYINRGAVTRVNAAIDPAKNLTLGRFESVSRDHFVSGDIMLQYRWVKQESSDVVPYVNLGIRNDFYIVSNYKISSDDPYFASIRTDMQWMRTRHYRPYVAGIVGGVGLKVDDLELGIEYYHQVYGSYAIPVHNAVHYSRLLSRSLQLTLSYSF